ncbi:hypothetical protein HO173_011809 [Letharia columbiana]|uniref:Uncharacterized protein n=1 Tax=Letharia columbiana TaxID=112416 RepID=A0A8H6CS77_9LECA|nr:uncharacterized protein HO173_011809 [Letharia columbiana]KAF6228638.1 hypothetical protein HO173_011809 [Letharia columbiana]
MSLGLTCYLVLFDNEKLYHAAAVQVESLFPAPANGGIVYEMVYSDVRDHLK